MQPSSLSASERNGARRIGDRKPLRVAVAVSGGRDSVGLLHVLREIAGTWETAGRPARNIELSVAHFNHKLRGAASDEDERFVAEMARALDLRFHRAEGAVAEVKDNLEQAARNARRKFFRRLIDDGLADRVALGHTMDDQSETVLFRLLRGSGLAGLAGIYPVTAEGFVRPLIAVPRSEIEQFLRERKIPWREDASNNDPRFARNRIRHSLLPQLARDWNPKISEALAHLADLAHEEERWWSEETSERAQEIFCDVATGGETRAIEGRVKAIAELPRSVARRVIRWAIAKVKGDLRQIGFRHVEAVWDLAVGDLAGDAAAGAGSRGGRLVLPGVEVARSFDWIYFGCLDRKPGRKSEIPGLEAKAPGKYLWPARNEMIHLDILKRGHPRVCATLEAELCWSSVPAPLELRGWRPGDHYRPLGRSRDQKVKEMFQRARIPSWQRRSWPILTGGNRILWAKAFGVASEFASDAGSGPILRIRETGG